uniref:Protein FMC1 homolog n=1 Tax=Timema douglasi TaxID=61478 RepID=A0A7R8VN51_TIMDO|nr:unnamed protein product [Timema douglasi]
MLRQLTKELRHCSPEQTPSKSLVMRYVIAQSRHYKETDQQLCKARDEVMFMGETYLCYLQSLRRYQDIHTHYAGKGERSVRETADMVGFKLPHDPK